jgi:hypothetical protein
MSIKSFTLLEGASITPSGGTSKTCSELMQIQDGYRIHIEEDTDYETKRYLDFKSREPRPKAEAPNGYTQARRSLLIRHPLSLDNGKITVNTSSYVLAIDPETSAAEVAEYLIEMAQLLVATATSQFFSVGSQA